MRKRAIRPKLQTCTLEELKKWMADYTHLMNCDVRSITDYVLVSIRWLDQGSYDYPDICTVKQKAFSIADVTDSIFYNRTRIESIKEEPLAPWEHLGSNDKTKEKQRATINRDRVKYVLFWMVHCGILDVATKHHDKTGRWSQYFKDGQKRPSYVFWLKDVPNRITLHPLRVYRTLWTINSPDKYNGHKKKEPVCLVPPAFDLFPDLPVMPRPTQPSLFNGNAETIKQLDNQITCTIEEQQKCNQQIRRFNNSFRSAKYENGKLFVAMRLTPEQAKLMINEIGEITNQVRTLDHDIWPDATYQKNGDWHNDNI